MFPCSSVGHIFPLIAQIYTEPRGSFIRQLRQLERQLKSIIPCIVFIVLLVVGIVFNIFRVSVQIRARPRGIISPCASRRNLNNLI